MKVSYTELNQKVSGDLRGLSVAQSAKGKVVIAQESTFSEIPEGSQVRLRSVSFSKLEVGDFILISTNNQLVVRRFLKLDLSKGSTRLVVASGKKEEDSIPFTRLVGRIEGVRRGENRINPNPSNFLQRLAFRISYRFTAA